MKIILSLSLLLSVFSLSSFAKATKSSNPILDLCNQQTYNYQKEECVKELNQYTFSNATFNLCNQLTYFYQKKDCMLDLKNKQHTKGIESLCNEHTYSYQKKECLIEFADLYLGPASEICLQKTYLYQKKECMKSFATSEPNVPLAQKLLNKIQRAKTALSNGNVDRVQKILNRLERQVQNNQGNRL